MLTITLYTKDGCHLCEQVKEMLPRFQSDYPHQLIEVDITQDDRDYARYHHKIPVLHIGDQVVAAPITAVKLEAALDHSFSDEKKL